MKEIKIKEEFQIPGTNLILEKGDKIKIKESNIYDLLSGKVTWTGDYPDDLKDDELKMIASGKEKSDIANSVKSIFSNKKIPLELNIFTKSNKNDYEKIIKELKRLNIKYAYGNFNYYYWIVFNSDDV